MTSGQFISQIRRYAQDRLGPCKAEIIANLARHTANFGNGPLVLDIALPGAGYFSVAAGGLADVLHEVGEYIHVDRFIGASGGACSLFLILANEKREKSSGSPPSSPGPCPSAEELLQAYLQYAESEGSGHWQQSWNACRQMPGHKTKETKQLQFATLMTSDEFPE